jgi:hypothetical protein
MEDRRQTVEDGGAPGAIGATSATVALVGLAAAVRAACFPFTWENGDAPARIALAVRWLHDPSLMSAKDCSQFGPLPIFWNACILSVWSDPYTAPRFLSLLFGIATALPLFFLTRVLFGQRAAVFSCLFFAFYTLHVKLSCTALAEAPFGFFFITCLFYFFRFCRDGKLQDLLLAAAFLSLGSMVRYEGWLYIPLLGFLAICVPATLPERPKLRLKPAFAFIAIASICPVLWMAVNYVKVGDPLWAWHFNAADLARIASNVARHRGVLGGAAYSVLFLPGVLVLSLTPVVALLALAGFLRFVLRGKTLAYAALFLPFVVYFIQTIMGWNPPTARYLLLPGLLALPYAGAYMDIWTAGTSREGAFRKTIGVSLSAAGVLCVLAFAAYQPHVPFQQKFWSVAPVSPFLPEEKKVYGLIRNQLKPGCQLLQDSSAYSHVITFNASPAIYETWWGRPTLNDLPGPEERMRYLGASAPAVLIIDREETNLPQLLNLPANANGEPEIAAHKVKVRFCLKYSSPKYFLYELLPEETKRP